MSRPLSVVKRADASLYAAVLDLWAAYRDEKGPFPEGMARTVSPAAVRAALERPDTIAFVAVQDAVPVGYAVVTDCSLNPFSDQSCLSIEHVFVVREGRRQGLARALLAAVAAHAERCGVDQIASNVPSAARDANRFFARFGFTPLTTRRIIPTSSLRRRLAGESTSRSSLEHVLARRRSAKHRAERQQFGAQTP